jgi:hypothetical protein
VHLGAHLAQFGSFVLLDQVIDQTTVVDAMRQGLQLQNLKLGLLRRSSWFPQKSKSGRFEFGGKESGGKETVPLEKFKVLMDAQDRQGSHTKAMHARTSGARRPSPAGWLEGGPVGYLPLQRPSGSLGCPPAPITSTWRGAPCR